MESDVFQFIHRPYRANCVLRTSLVCLFILGLSLQICHAKDKIMVWRLDSLAGVTDQETKLFSGVISSEVAYRSGMEVVSEEDIQSILEGAAIKQMCDADASSCMVEIGNAMGIPEVVSGDLGRMGGIWILNLRRINVKTAEVISRVSRREEGNIKLMLQLIPRAVIELFGRQDYYDETENPLMNGIVVWNLKPRKGVSKKEASSFSGIVAGEVSRYSKRHVISETDIRTILEGHEKAQQCGVEDTSCLADIGSSIGVPNAISGDIGHMGDSWILNLRLINVNDAKQISRQSVVIEGPVGKMIDSIPKVVANLLDFSGFSDDEGIAGQNDQSSREAGRNKTSVYSMNPYNKAGHGLFWSGLVLATFGGTCHYISSLHSDLVDHGKWDSEKKAETWQYTAYAMYGIGGAAMVAGAVLWIVAPSDEEWLNTHFASIGPSEGGQGLTFTFRTEF